MAQPHFIVITYPAQGHINPSLQLAKRLIRASAYVTFVTSTYATQRMSKFPTMDGLKFIKFPDGCDSGFKPTDALELEGFMSAFERLGSQALTDLVMASADEGRPVTCIIYGILIPWIAEVARRLQIPSALFWSQPLSVFNIYYYYFHGYGDLISRKVTDSSASPSIELPGLPLLGSSDIPCFLLASNSKVYSYILSVFQKHLEMLHLDSNPTILINTFDALEPEAFKAVGKFNSIGVGPLFPTAFLGGKDPSDTSFGGDLFRRSKDYIEWLNSKPESSVIYVSFGSLTVLSKQQSEEIARGLLDSGRPFLWVIREKGEEEEDKLSCYPELEQKGMIVPWCSQVEVLSNPSLGCFVTHCGWNSTLESLVCGVPVVAFPQWTDQSTNAKLAEDMWKTGVRVMVNQEGIVDGDEIKRCIELVMGDGEEVEEMRRNAKKWKGLAREAVMEGGSSDKNLKNFMDGLIHGDNH